MKEEKLKELLSELTEKTAESAPPGLAEDIKHNIPHRLIPHKGGMDTINVMIDLRISKLTAAAAIIITMVLCVSFLGGRDSAGGSIYQDGKLLAKYLMGGISVGRSDMLAGRLKYEHLLHQGKEIVYYGDSIDPADSNAVMMQWKLPNGDYSVVFGDLREKTVSADELIKLQTQMLQKKAKR